MHSNEELINAFYSAFQRRDADAMAACYHADIEFDDEVFVHLAGRDASDMWRMLCARGKDLRVEFREVSADDVEGSAQWDAWYTFSKTGRSVHNRIHAQFTFRDGLIVSHIDRFNFSAWARQALGPIGLLLGWSGWLRGRVRRQAAENLAEFSRSRTES